MLVHINDRSKLDQVVCYIPKENRSVTLLEDLRESQYAFRRTDIVLINMTNSGTEYTLHVSEIGYSGDLWILDILSPEQYSEVEGIAFRMRRNAIDYAECKKLLV